MSPEITAVNDQEARQQWLERRRAGIGGSDAPAILGLSPWKSPLALWAEKTGLVQEPNLEELEYIEWGHILEEPIAARYVKVTGRSLIDPGRFAIRTDPDRPWMHCTIDREVEIAPSEPPKDGPGDLSIKNAGAYKAKDWEEEPPLLYQVQLQHELAVTGLSWGSFAVLIGGNKFHWCDVPRNGRFISYLIEKEEEFWDRVQRGDPPPADASDSTREVLLRLYPRDTGESKELPPETFDWIERRRAAKAAQKAAEAELDQVENLIKAAIGEASIGLLGGIPAISWKHQHRDGYTVAPSDFRVLREIKPKKGAR
jgi:putative phage-type endonuclease